MVASRFSVGTHPCLESRHHTCLDLKGITIRPTRPEGTMKGLRHNKQREDKEEHQHQQDQLIYSDGSSVVSLEVPVQGGNPTRPLSLRIPGVSLLSPGNRPLPLCLG